ncbi:MAG TPA: DinB family protein [Chitinophagaceae bacterium]|nr:DinB family protein [Chitinophagaceae bacterium]
MLKEAYEGGPWHGRSIKALLGEVSPKVGLAKPNANSHSIAELVYHMVTWRDFTISRLQPDGKDVQYYEDNDWRKLDLDNEQTWHQGLQLLEESQQRLVSVLEQFQDSILPEKVADRKYNFRVLLYGVVQHDVYHAGQIAYAKKLLS